MTMNERVGAHSRSELCVCVCVGTLRELRSATSPGPKSVPGCIKRLTSAHYRPLTPASGGKLGLISALDLLFVLL